jgi:hypothetical protein
LIANNFKLISTTRCERIENIEHRGSPTHLANQWVSSPP